jgi:hypothetical protein
MNKLEVEARQKEQEDRANVLQQQQMKDREYQERMANLQLQQVHAEILRRQSEENHKKKLMQRSVDLSPGFDLASFPLSFSREKLTKSQKQQIMARELEQQLHDKQMRKDKLRTLDAEYDALQDSMIRSQNEIDRINRLNARLKVRDELTKSWSDNKRAKSMMRYIEGKNRTNPLEDSLYSADLLNGSQRTRNFQSAAIDLGEGKSSPASPVQQTAKRALFTGFKDIDEFSSKKRSPSKGRDRQTKQAPQLKKLTHKELAKLQETIRQNEISVLNAQIEEKFRQISSHSPAAATYHKKLLDEASALLVSAI